MRFFIMGYFKTHYDIRRCVNTEDGYQLLGTFIHSPRSIERNKYHKENNADYEKARAKLLDFYQNMDTNRSPLWTCSSTLKAFKPDTNGKIKGAPYNELVKARSEWSAIYKKLLTIYENDFKKAEEARNKLSVYIKPGHIGIYVDNGRIAENIIQSGDEVIINPQETKIVQMEKKTWEKGHVRCFTYDVTYKYTHQLQENKIPWIYHHFSDKGYQTLADKVLGLCICEEFGTPMTKIQEKKPKQLAKESLTLFNLAFNLKPLWEGQKSESGKYGLSTVSGLSITFSKPQQND